MARRRSVGRVVLLAASVLVGAVPLLSGTAHALTNCTVSAADQAIDSEEYKFVGLLNDYRVSFGLNRLVMHPDTSRAAAWFSRDMANDNYFPSNHVDDLGRDIPTRLRQCDAVFTSWGENIAFGYTTAQEVFDAWKASQIHNDIMKLSGINTMGIARALRPGTSTWYWALDVTQSVLPRPADYDNDNKSDVGVYRPSNSNWYIQRSAGGTTIVNWGSTNDVPTGGDFDFDGQTDIAVFRPANGNWYIQGSLSGTRIVNWGASGDVPIPADYDGDGHADIAVYRPTNGNWYVNRSQLGTLILNWGGANGDVPVAGDYDGDGKADIGVFRASSGNWYIQRSTGGTTIVNWGASGDVPRVGDYDGDGKADIAVYRPATGNWYIRLSSTGGARIVNWGGDASDIPVSGDYDGDGRSDIAVFRASSGNWYIQRSTGGTTIVNWGASGDIPVGQPPLIGP